MTNDDDRIDDNPTARAIMEGVERMLAESRAIDTRAALEGIKSRRFPPRSRRHSVSHKSYR